MTITTTAGEAGIGNEITIDGQHWPRPPVLEWVPAHARSMTPSVARPRLELWNMGDGLPNVVDRGEWVMRYMLTDQYQALNAYLELLRMDGEVHELSVWKKRISAYTTRTGQQAFWLPRADAWGFGGVVDEVAKAVVTRNNVPLTVTYKPVVAPGDTVPAGNVWISQTIEKHPTAGFYGVRFVVGTANVINDRIRVEHHGKYRVAVADHTTEPFERVSIEEKEVVFAEVA